MPETRGPRHLCSPMLPYARAPQTDALNLGTGEGCLKARIHLQANTVCCILKNISECVEEVSHHIHTHVKESDL